MASPYKKAVRHALDCASRGLGVESCGYTSPTWRGVWLQAYQRAKQMDFPLDDFEDDINTAEDNINATNKHGSEKSDTLAHELTEGQTDGDAQPDNKGQGAATAHRQALGLFPGISNEKYHNGPGIGSTNIKPAIKSMNLYNEARLGRVPFKQTEAMLLGSAVHVITLEAYDFGNQIAVSKKFGRTDAAKQEKAEFYAANPGKIVITADDYDRCRWMSDSLLNLAEVRDIFETGKPEMSGYYIDRKTNMLCKYRADWENEWCIFDIKSTRDASAESFSRTINDLKYHLSAAHYLDGSHQLTRQAHNWFVFGCVESEYPFEAAVYRLNDESLEEGHRLRRNGLDQIKHGRDTDEWPLLNNGLAQEIGIPHWALNDLRLSKI